MSTRSRRASGSGGADQRAEAAADQSAASVTLSPPAAARLTRRQSSGAAGAAAAAADPTASSSPPSVPATSAARRSSSLRAAEALAEINAQASEQKQKQKHDTKDETNSTQLNSHHDPDTDAAATAARPKPRRRPHKPASAEEPSPPPPAAAAAAAAASSPVAAAAAASSPPPSGRRPSRQAAAVKRRSYTELDSDGEENADAAAPAASAAAAASASASQPRSARKKALQQSKREQSEERKDGDEASAMEDEEPAAASSEEDEEEDDGADAYEESSADDDASASEEDEDASVHASEDDDEFTLTPVESKSKRRKKVKASSSSKKRQSKPSAAKKQAASPAATATAPSSSSKTRKPTAAQRKRSLIVLSPDTPEEKTLTPSQEESDRRFREFAAAIDPPKRSTASKRNSSSAAPAARTPSKPAAVAPIALSDDDDIMEIEAFVPSANKPSRHNTSAAASAVAASSGPSAAAAWSNLGLRPVDNKLLAAAAAASKSSSSKAGKGKGSAAAAKPSSSGPQLPQSERDSRLNQLCSMLGEAAVSSRSTVLKYLEAAGWSVDTAVCKIMDSTWFQSSHSAEDQTAAPTAGSAQAAAAASHNAIDISDDESVPAAAAAASSSSSAPKRKLAGSSPAHNKKSRSSGAAASANNSTLDGFAGLKSEPSADDADDDAALAPSTGLAPPELPSWDRKLLCLLNVRAQSLTHGTNIMVAGDELEFRRESFDLDDWGEKQRAAEEERKADAKANAAAIAASSSSSAAASGAGPAAAKKKPALPRVKSKAVIAAAALKKRASRVLRFAKKGASASHLEIGSVPALLTELLAPLFDSGCIDLDSQVLSCPAKVDPFDCVVISLSIFVLPSLFMWRPPSSALEALEAAQSANPFFRAVYAKKHANAHLVWNPVEAFAKLLKACGLTPIASVEAELDEQAAKTKAEADAAAAAATAADPVTLDADADVQMNGEQPANAAAASSSSTAAASSSSAAAAAVAAPAADDSLGVDEADAGPNNEGASVSRFQLDALYAGAAASCAVIPEADAPPELRTTLKAYQRQALHWMMARESNHDDARANTQLDSTLSSSAAGVSAAAASDRRARPRHPLFEEYTFADEPLNTPFWINPFSNEITLKFPESTGSCMGGALCDEMGLGKTVMTISLILAHHPSKLLLDPSENEEVKAEPALAAAAAATAASSLGDERNNVDDDDEEVEVMDAPASAAAAASSSSSAAAASAAPAASASSSFFDSVNSSRSRHRRSYMLHQGVCGATLVVCPMSLLSQWRDEIARFSNLDTLIYHGNKQDRRKVDFAQYDVVLTSYGVVASEHRAVLAAQTAASAAAGGQKNAPASLSARQLASLSPLFSTNFWRIALDEAHTIRNRSTEQAKAVFRLRGVRRWVITGTLIQNKIDDVFAPLKFLGEEPWCSWGWWHAVISAPFEKQDSLALQRLRAILTPLMLRRTKAMRTASGESIVELPPRVDSTLVCDFSAEEQAFYTAIYTRSKAQFEGFVASGAVMNKYIQVLTLLLRLRQCCDHMFLILGRSRTDDEFQADIDQFLHKFASRIDMLAPNAPTISFLESLAGDLKKTGADRSECPICLDTPSIPVLTECGHLSCRECLSPLFNERGFARCPVCRAIVSRDKLFLVPAQDSGDDGLKRIDPVRDWVHSCKTSRLLAELKSIRLSDDPTAKSIIFSQWTSMLDLIEIPLRKEGFSFLRLDGTLSQKERTDVLRAFASPGSAATILLISLRAGGQGLNLVSANHVFLFDCWWNPSVEEQAVQRVHRIGQTKTSYVRRFVVRGSVEERILELQKRKSHLAQAVSMTPDEQKSMRMNDLVDLFRST